LRGRVKEIKGRKVIVSVELFAHDELCARGEVVTVQVPDDFMAKLMNP
jgi:acyl-CoA thioesterase FadM